MNTLHFKYAVEVEKTGSISQAAENLFMAQPNLSKAIKELEDSLGIVIFERTSKGVIPTAQGKKFLIYAKRILVQLDKMKSIYIPPKQYENHQAVKISIPRVSYISAGFANFVSELSLSEGIDVTLQETNSIQTISNVADNGFNLGIIRYQNLYENYFLDYLKRKGLKTETIWEFPRLVLMSKEHPLADAAEIDYDTLISTSIEIAHSDNLVPYILNPEINPIGSAEDQYNSKRVYLYERGSQMELLTRVPYTFIWVSPIPRHLLTRYQLVQRHCKTNDNLFKDVLIYPQGYKLSSIDRLFLNKLYEVKNEVAFDDVL